MFHSEVVENDCCEYLKPRSLRSNVSPIRKHVIIARALALDLSDKKIKKKKRKKKEKEKQEERTFQFVLFEFEWAKNLGKIR